MTKAINQYGDKLAPTTGKHGSNISEQRIDDLDQACLTFVKERIAQGLPCQAVDIGCGSGAQSKRMADLGASVFMADLTDQQQLAAAYNAKAGRVALRFIQRDIREIMPETWPQTLDCVYTQRMLGALPYRDALQLMTFLKSRAAPDAHFFVSASGYDAEYQNGYPDKDKPVEERWALLDPAIGAKHNVLIPQCLYRASELAQMLEKAGLTVERFWTSPFGNPKVIARML